MANKRNNKKRNNEEGIQIEIEGDLAVLVVQLGIALLTPLVKPAGEFLYQKVCEIFETEPPKEEHSFESYNTKSIQKEINDSNQNDIIKERMMMEYAMQLSLEDQEPKSNFF
jgi:hypothetical protein